MNDELVFPEITYYVDNWFQEEQELFTQFKKEIKNNSLEEQLRLVSLVLAKTKSNSDLILFVLGKILYNLSLFDELEKELVKHKNNNYLFLWQGFSFTRKGEYDSAVIIFQDLVEEEDHLISLSSKIGLARIKDRRGIKKEAILEFKQVKENLTGLLVGNKKQIYLDVWFNCIYGDLWTARTEKNIEDSKKSCLENLHLAKEYQDRIHIAKLNNLLGVLEKYSGNWNNSKNYFELAEKYYRELGDKRGEASTFSNLADVERMQGNFDSAENRLQQIIPLYEKINDKRSLAIAHRNLGEIYAQKRLISSSIDEFVLAKSILEEIGAKDALVYYSLAELYIEQGKVVEFNQVLGGLLEGQTIKEIEQNPHILYFFGKKEIQNLNISKGKNYLNQALKIAVKMSMGHLSAKILIDLIQVILFNYLSDQREEDLQECEKLLDDLKLFTEDKHLDTSFKPILLDIDGYCKSISKTKSILDKRRLVLEAQKIIKELVDLIRYNISPEQDTAVILPNQLIILHRSGIPLKKYLKKKRIVDDVLLFGGMVRAAKDIISEIFTSEIGKVMKIDYGEDIVILAEFGNKETGIVMITRKDTFHQRRALHESVKELNQIAFPDKYHGEINDSLEQSIDEVIFKWFGDGYLGEK